MSTIINQRRMAALFRLHEASGRKGLLLATGGFLGFVLIVSFFVTIQSPEVLENLHSTFFLIFLYGGLVGMAGTAFHMMNSRTKSISYLSLPASVAEKFLVPWLMTGIGWILFSIIVYTLFALLVNSLWSLVLNVDFVFYSPLARYPFFNHWLEPYMMVFFSHSIFFLGSAAFRNYAIPKTLLAGFIVYASLIFIAAITMLLLYHGLSPTPGEENELTSGDPERLTQFYNTSKKIYQYSFMYILPVIFYLAAFFKIKEREA